LGFRVSIDKQREFACELLTKLAPKLGDDFVQAIIEADRPMKRASTTSASAWRR
jgi:pyruvate-ferredoxin/flavodoxin oxidoreductase